MNTHQRLLRRSIAVLFFIPALAWGAETATINCLSTNGGFSVDGGPLTILQQGDTTEFAVSPDGSILEL
ncbi:MAG: hypothetical protein P8Y54_11385, partial [Xanthomonadales bacterium]